MVYFKKGPNPTDSWIKHIVRQPPERGRQTRACDVDSDGDRTRYSLSDFEINGELSKDEFTLDLPPDVEIQEFQFKSR